MLNCRVGLANLGNGVSCVVLSRLHWPRKLKVNLRSKITPEFTIRVRVASWPQDL